jgi:DNA (cytosine-5)-methyltransferase 1
MLDPNSEMGRIAQRIRPGQKLCNVRGGPRAIHTWDIPEVFGRTTKGEKKLLEALLHLRRRYRVRATGDADPVSATVLARELQEPVGELLAHLETKGFVRKINGKFDLTHTFNGKFRRLEWDAPAYTVDTRFGNPRYFLHPAKNRGFSVREAARIQGFPDSFVFTGPLAAQYRMIGNAVSPPTARVLAQAIRECLLT